jgi:hypothetical protein
MTRTDSGIIQFTRGRSRTKDLGRHPARQTRDTSITAITFNPERRAESYDPERRATDTVSAAPHVSMIKLLCKFTLKIGLLTVVAAGTIALKTAIWFPHFNQ